MPFSIDDNKVEDGKKVSIGTKFQWNEQKAKENLQKHEVSFEEAASVFEDPNLYLAEDDIHSIDEERFIAIGFCAHNHLLFAVHCYRENDTVIRACLISFFTLLFGYFFVLRQINFWQYIEYYLQIYLCNTKKSRVNHRKKRY